MRVSTELIMEEKKDVMALLATVSAGVETGYKLATTTDWKVPDDKVMLNSVMAHIKLDPVKRQLRNASLIDEERGDLDKGGAVDCLK